jgi:radical SAM-linked protein
VRPNRPDVPERVLRRVATPIPAYSIGLVPFVETVHDRLTVEIRRGCTRGCRFCQPGMLTRPARDVDPEQVVDTIEKGMRATGYNEFSLLSLSCSDYLSLPAVGMEVKNRLKDDNISLSLPSQRVDRFDENIANIIGGTRQSGLTFAPEAGTQRMRDIINKGLTNEELLRGVKTAYEQGWDKVKLYFMIGLPGESDADVMGIAETVRWLQRECSAKGRRRLNINLTISNFTPKPHTPFQWHTVSTSEFLRKQEMLRQEFRRMRGVKANFTDVRISAMEDFVGRGDRRLSAVVRRAWELGAGMDSWWESLDRAFKAWEDAIDEAGLTWKYRQVESGEWNVFNDESSQTENTDVFDAPLPWDYLNTGIDKEWLKQDLQRALEAATVPDCAYEGCSHCGVCTPDFGHNIVVPPPPIPEFSGHFQPNTDRVQRLRVWLGKLEDMALIGHLDFVRLLDRTVRRAALPISYNGGYHPMPRISPANALPLGATSSGEIVEFDLKESLDPESFRLRLAEQLPESIPVYRVEEVPVSGKAVTRVLEAAEYRITLTCPEGEPQWQKWVESVRDRSEIWSEHTTKSGKVKQVNLRDRLFAIDVTHVTPDSATLTYVGSCRNDGTLLRPSQFQEMLESVSGVELQLQQVHRQRLILASDLDN